MVYNQHNVKYTLSDSILLYMTFPTSKKLDTRHGPDAVWFQLFTIEIKEKQQILLASVTYFAHHITHSNYYDDLLLHFKYNLLFVSYFSLVESPSLSDNFLSSVFPFVVNSACPIGSLSCSEACSPMNCAP